MTTPRSTRSGWLAGLTVGAAAGLLFGVWPTFGIGIAGAFAAGALWTRQPAGLSGLLVGLPATWLLAVAGAMVSCARFDAGAGQECRPPDVTGWVIVAVGLLVAGLAGSGVLLRRNRAR